MKINTPEQQASRKIAAKLLEIGAIKLGVTKPFRWSSGLSAPIYCDNRIALSYPDVRNYIKMQLVLAVRSNFRSVQGISGVATAGIPHGAMVADFLRLPFSYVRASQKSHGTENRVEGKVEQGQKLVLVEDLVSTGKSSINAAQALMASGAELLGVLAIFSYEFESAVNSFKELKLPLITLCGYSDLLEEAKLKDILSGDDLNFLKTWHMDPANWKA